MGLFIRDSLFLKYSVSILDSKSDGILWVLLLDQSCNQSITICICYLPPSNSSRGDISLEFFNTLRFQVSKYHDTGIVCICGDFNARVGSLIDTDSDTATSLPVRATLDNTVPNSHGRELIDFLRDVGTIILNGRGNSENNSFTYIGPNGSSVVDYCLIPIDKQHLFEDFKVLPIPEASTNFHIPVDCSSQITPSSYCPLN